MTIECLRLKQSQSETAISKWEMLQELKIKQLKASKGRKKNNCA